MTAAYEERIFVEHLPDPDEVVTEVPAPAPAFEGLDEPEFLEHLDTGIQGDQGIQGQPGLGSIVIEADETEPPPGTPVGTIVFQRVI